MRTSVSVIGEIVAIEHKDRVRGQVVGPRGLKSMRFWPQKKNRKGVQNEKIRVAATAAVSRPRAEADRVRRVSEIVHGMA